MTDRDYIWECDYGERARYLDALKVIVDSQNADELSMCAIFANNNLYNLELFIVLSYDKPQANQIDQMLKIMSGVGARQRPDIPMMELMKELSGKRYNSMTILDSSTVEAAKASLFVFPEREELAGVISMKPLGKSIPVFLSHSSRDKPFVEDIIPYLTHNGLPVWYDNISIDYGEGIASAVQSGIKDSGAVIFIITKAFLSSSWCKLEMDNFISQYADGNEILLLTVVSSEVEHEQLPLFLKNIKYLRLDSTDTAQVVAKELMPSLLKHFGSARFKNA